MAIQLYQPKPQEGFKIEVRSNKTYVSYLDTDGNVVDLLFFKDDGDGLVVQRIGGTWSQIGTQHIKLDGNARIAEG